MEPVANWQNFYYVLGSSAAALIGLQFVVLTLIATLPVQQNMHETGQAFSTPIIVHFSSVLLLAGVFSAPWDSEGPLIALWALLGLSGVIYCLVVNGRIHRQNAYAPDGEDWTFYFLLPFIAYVILTLSALGAIWNPKAALYGAGTAAFTILCTGIRNAWDIVTYAVFIRRGEITRSKKKKRKR